MNDIRTGTGTFTYAVYAYLVVQTILRTGHLISMLHASQDQRLGGLLEVTITAYHHSLDFSTSFS